MKGGRSGASCLSVDHSHVRRCRAALHGSDGSTRNGVVNAEFGGPESCPPSHRRQP
jgi:hypothetical protein